MEDLGDPRIVVAIAIYWFIGGYMALALTPLAFEAGLVAMIIGLVLHLWRALLKTEAAIFRTHLAAYCWASR
jgi:hypothetical protein